jgi:formylglycine-generating enzyme required for sulfatase activity
MPAARRHQRVSWISVVIPSVFILVFGAGIARELGLFENHGAASDGARPATVSIPPHAFSYRADGEYCKNGFAVDAPRMEREISRPLSIMKFEVSEAEYARCVSAGQGTAPAAGHVHGDDRPVTGVSWEDATAYSR